MTWLTLRQFRVQAIAMAGLVLALAVLFTVAGRPGPSAGTLVDSLYYVGNIAVYLIPALLGAFWGAPLVARELEAGTHSLVWNQGVTRGQWLTTKLTVIGSAAALLACAAGLAMTRWAGTAPQEGLRLLPVVFGARGVAPAGYALFAFCLGVIAGILLRRVLSAMAVTLVVFLAVQLAVPLLVREHLVPVTREAVVITTENIAQIELANSDAMPDRLGEGITFDAVVREIQVQAPPGAWVIDSQLVDAAGNATAVPPMLNTCAALTFSPGTSEKTRECLREVADAGYRQSLAYHPTSDFWRLQWVELGLFLVLSGTLVRLSFRRIRRVR